MAPGGGPIGLGFRGSLERQVLGATPCWERSIRMHRAYIMLAYTSHAFVEEDLAYPTIVVLMQDSHNLTNLEFELIIHRRLELKLDTVDSATRRVGDNSTRSSTRKSCYRYDRSHANLGLDLGARSYRGIDVEASRSGAGYRTALKLDRWAQ